MAVPCPAKNKVIPIRKGISILPKELQGNLPNLYFTCATCGFGSNPSKRWQPLMETSCCPMCGSQKKR